MEFFKGVCQVVDGGWWYDKMTKLLLTFISNWNESHSTISHKE